MDKLYMMKELNVIYENGNNIIDYLHQKDGGVWGNSIADILISYDFQAGSYYDEYRENTECFGRYHDQLASILNEYIRDDSSVMEAGVGEARSIVPIMNRLEKKKISNAYGFDLSWSRIKYAEKFEKDYKECDRPDIRFWVGDIINIAVKDSAIDVVFTVGACEPNGGKERELLRELYRVTRRYLVLFEPAYDLADDEARKRMKKYGYVTRLYEEAKELKYNIIRYELLDISLNPMNPMGVIVIEKNRSERGSVLGENVFCDPISKADLEKYIDAWFCEESMLAYPVIGGIPLLMKENAIVATKYQYFNHEEENKF